MENLDKKLKSKEILMMDVQESKIAYRNYVDRGISCSSYGEPEKRHSSRSQAGIPSSGFETVLFDAMSRPTQEALQAAQAQIEQLKAELASGTPAEVARLSAEKAELGRQKLAAEGKARRAEERVTALGDEIILLRAAKTNAEARARVAEARLNAGNTNSFESWDPQGYYRLLGISSRELAQKLTPDQLKKLFRNISQVLHPDAGGDTSAQQKLSAAYDFLSDPVKSRTYGR